MEKMNRTELGASIFAAFLGTLTASFFSFMTLDIISSSVIMASIVYHAAMRDEKLPRKPMPKEPTE